MLKENPLVTVERSKVQAYGKTQAIAKQDVEQALNQIDRSQLAGKRNYALLVLFLGTGCRLSEVAELLLYQLSKGNNSMITLTFEAKGEKTMIDTLSPARTNALTLWLNAFYGEESWSLGKVANTRMDHGKLLIKTVYGQWKRPDKVYVEG